MYLILEKAKKRTRLEPPPARMRVVVTLEVVIEDPGGANLLLKYAYSQGPNSTGYWAPPYAWETVEGEPYSAEEALQVFDEKSIDTEKMAKGLADMLGIANVGIKRLDEFTEFKASTSQPDIPVCYRIVRYGLPREISEEHLPNVLDSECLRGHVFFPLDAATRANFGRGEPIDGDGDGAWWYLGKPVASNVKYVLEQDAAGVGEVWTKAPPERFSDDYKGVLVCADLANFGTTTSRVDVDTLSTEGKKVATDFRQGIAHLFNQFFAELGTLQVHLAGDGFICAIPTPDHSSAEISAVIRRVLERHEPLRIAVERVNKFLNADDKQLGTRLALHYGSYSYGRVGRSRAATPSFDGAAVIEVARLESSLGKYVKRTQAQAPEELRHSLISSPQLRKAAGRDYQEAVLHCGATSLGTKRVGSKEYKTSAALYSLPAPPQA